MSQGPSPLSQHPAAGGMLIAPSMSSISTSLAASTAPISSFAVNSAGGSLTNTSSISPSNLTKGQNVNTMQIPGQSNMSGQGIQLGQQGSESGQGPGLPMNLGGPGQANFGSGGGVGSGTSVMPSSVATNLGGMPSVSMPSASSSSNAPPPYDTGPHMTSFGDGIGGGHPISSVPGSGVSIPPGQYSDPSQPSQTVPSGMQAGGPNVRPAPNLEAARYYVININDRKHAYSMWEP